MNNNSIIPKYVDKEEGWREVQKGLPPHGVEVLAFYQNYYGKNRIIRACYYERFREESNLDDESNDEYCENDDNYYIKEGWYECIDNWGDYNTCFVNDGIVSHWMPLPDPPTFA